MNDSPVNFYEVEDEYGLFSNFAPRPIELDGKLWPMSEHYYQAHRFEGTYLMETVRNIPEPMDAALFGRNPENPTRPDWFDHRVAAMLCAVRAKVAQHSDVRELLLSTGDRIIAEHTLFTKRTYVLHREYKSRGTMWHRTHPNINASPS